MLQITKALCFFFPISMFILILAFLALFLAQVLGVLDVLEVFLVESERKVERMVVAVDG